MKTFLEFLEESYQGKINWTKPDAASEHGEVHHQLQSHEDSPFLPDWVHKRMQQLKDPKEFKKAMNGGKTKTYTRKDVQNTNNTGEKWSEVEKDTKKRRAPTLYGKGKKVQRPVVLKNPETGETHLLGGHHRATYVTDVLKKPAEVHEIT